MLRHEAVAALEVRALGRACWLRREMREALTDVNRRCLGLLADQVLSPGACGQPALRQVGELWRALDERSRWQAAACPFLLFDAGFGDPAPWCWPGAPQIADGGRPPCAPFFTVPQTAAVARTVFVYAWSLVIAHADGARVVLGIHPHCASLLGACTVPQVHELAECHAAWLRPRWLSRAELWRQMLVAAAEDDVVSLERSRTHGLQMMAAQTCGVAPPGRLPAWSAAPSMHLQ